MHITSDLDHVPSADEARTTTSPRLPQNEQSVSVRHITSPRCPGTPSDSEALHKIPDGEITDHLCATYRGKRDDGTTASSRTSSAESERETVGPPKSTQKESGTVLYSLIFYPPSLIQATRVYLGVSEASVVPIGRTTAPHAPHNASMKQMACNSATGAAENSGPTSRGPEVSSSETGDPTVSSMSSALSESHSQTTCLIQGIRYRCYR